MRPVGLAGPNTPTGRLSLMVAIMVVLASAVGALSVYLLYHTALREERTRLAEIAESQARLMEAVAGHDPSYTVSDPAEGGIGITLGLIAEAHDRFSGLGRTGEFVVARREGDEIVFLSSQRRGRNVRPDRIPVASALGEPIHHALIGESGTLVGRDYSGERVLAAYEPVGVLNVGLVAKIDLAEIRAPFYRTGILVLVGALGLIGLGVLLFNYVGQPIVRSLQAEVAERTSAVRELRESEERYHDLFNRMLNGFAVHEMLWDEKGNPRDYRFLEINPAFEALTGLRSEDVVGRMASEVIPGLEHEWIERYGEVARTGRAIHFELSAAALDRHFEVTAFQPRPNQFAAVFSDVTERKRATEEIARHREQLEELVAERTAELEAANKELEAFTYSVSHDLRSPLRAIHGFAGVLLDEHATDLDAEGKRSLGIVRENTALMAQLIDDLLELSRVGRSAIVQAEVDMCDLVRAVLEQQEREYPPERFHVCVGALPSAVGDGRLLRQVWANLLANAAKFSRDSCPPEIVVGANQVDGMTTYFVRDNGVGFDMQYAGKLFQTFSRLHSREEFEGTGVGLAIVKRIVERLGGTVSAMAAPDRGAIFSFSLPTGETS